MDNGSQNSTKLEFWRKLRFLGEVLGSEKKAAILVCVIILLAAIVESFGLSMILPILQVVVEGGLKGKLAVILDPLVSGMPGQYLFPFLCLLFLLMIILKSVFTMIRIFVTKKFVWQIRLQWLQRIFKQYLGAEYNFILNHKQGVLLNNLITETKRGAICLSRLTEYLASVILFIVLYITLILVHWQATVILSVVFGSLFLLTNRITKNFSRKIGLKKIKLSQKISGNAAESIGSIHQIKTFGINDLFFSRFSDLARELCRTEIRFDVVRAIPLPLGETVVSLLIVSGMLYISFYSSVSLKSFLPTLGVLVLIGQRMVSNISNLASMRIQILSLLPSVSLSHNLAENLIDQEDISNGEDITELKDDIVFEDVSFDYGNGRRILTDFNIVIQRGKMTALIGPSGSGKSTVANLLLDLYKPQSGQILINGKNISHWKLSAWRKMVGYVGQDVILFNMSIRDNIALGDPEATEEDVIKAARTASAHEFIINLPDGYDTFVGDRGLKLSGGQRQRIAIARAVIRDPHFIIFDEATSALDSESEKLVQKAIETVSRERTLLIIAHRLSTIENADAVYDISGMNVSRKDLK